METRTNTRTEVRVYKLILNPMRANAEACSLVAASTDYDRLVAWYYDQMASEPYRDGQWYKVFKAGSPLEWFNPASTLLNQTSCFGQGITDEWGDFDTWNGIVAGTRPFEIIE